MPRRRPPSDLRKAINAILASDQYKALRLQLKEQARSERYAPEKERRREARRSHVSKNALTPEEEARLDATIESVLRASRYRIRGEWEASEIEPFLKPLGSSLNPRSMGPNYVDVRGLRISEAEEI